MPNFCQVNWELATSCQAISPTIAKMLSAHSTMRILKARSAIAEFPRESRYCRIGEGSAGAVFAERGSSGLSGSRWNCVCWIRISGTGAITNGSLTGQYEQKVTRPLNQTHTTRKPGKRSISRKAAGHPSRNQEDGAQDLTQKNREKVVYRRPGKSNCMPPLSVLHVDLLANHPYFTLGGVILAAISWNAGQFPSIKAAFSVVIMPAG